MVSAVKDKNAAPLWVALYTELRADILSRRIRNGAKLSEAYVCKRYSVSRTPVREALQQLEAEGLVQIIPNRGAFVTGFSGRDISDLFDMRCLFEGQAAEWAIKRMDPEGVDKLYETLDFMEFYTLKGDPGRILEFDMQFHDIIYEGCGDRLIRDTLETYRTYLRNAIPSLEHSKEQYGDILEEHRKIYRAFEIRDAKGGRKAMEDHIRNSKARLINDYDLTDF